MFVIMSDSEMVVMLHVWIILTAGVQAQDTYEIKDNGAAVSWQTALKTCSLASPNLSYSADDITLDLDVKYPGLVERDEIWIGYAKAPQIFQYIGCVRDRTIWLKFPWLSHHQKSIADPGMCYSSCGNEYFGLMYVPSENISDCYCFDDDRFTKETGRDNTEDGCTSSCMNPKDTACGVSNLSFVKDGDADCKCCAYRPSTGIYEWSKCKSRILQNIICEIAGTVINTGDNKHRSWTNASEDCFKHNTYPVTYQAKTSLLPNADNTFWTGMIRSDVIFNAKALPSEQFILKPGYITLVNNAFKLKFMDHKKAFLTNKSLCYIDRMKVTPTATEPNSTNAQNKNFTHIDGQHENKTNLVSVYAGGAVAVFIAVVVSVGGYVCYRKRRNGQNNQHVYENEQTTGSNTNHNKVVGASVIYQNQPTDSLYPGSKGEDEHQTEYENKAAVYEDADDYNYITPIQNAYEETAKTDTVTFNDKHDGTSDDDNSEYVYPAQGPYEDLKHLQEHTSEIYNQLQKE